MKRHTAGPVLTRRELVRIVSAKTGLQQAIAFDAIRLVFDAVSDALADGGRCEFRDFGVFATSVRKGHIGRDPHRPEVTYDVPGHRVVRFRAGRRLRERVAKAK